jgi:hypothetical protein
MRRICILATLTLALAAAASAQTAGRIIGTIKDPDGKAIKGATVRATNEAVNARITSTTDDKGRFAMIGVRSGRWIIVAEAPNFLPLQGTADVSSSNYAGAFADAAARSRTDARRAGQNDRRGCRRRRGTA